MVGTSQGGTEALKNLLAALPLAFPLPMVIVQHRAANTEGMLAKLLERYTGHRVLEAEDKQGLEPGGVYLAPPDYHLLVDGPCLSLSTEAPVRYARPSIDVLFESAADAFGPGVIGIVLTGANEDGARGAARIKACGGHILVQEPATAENPVMPKAALEATSNDAVLPIHEIAAWLTKFTQPPDDPEVGASQISR